MFNKFRRIAYLYSRCGWRGVIAATRAKVTGEQVRVVVRPPEVKEPIYLRVPSSDLDTFEQVFRNGEYDFRASNPRFIIDAGANVGLASILFASRYPSARIIAIEPEQSNFDLLKENVAPYPSITPARKYYDPHARSGTWGMGIYDPDWWQGA
jgi:hypothetical protein